MNQTQSLNLTPEVYAALLQAAQERGVTPQQWISLYLPATPPPNGQTEKVSLGERLEQKGLLGVIDSSQPDDPASLPKRPPLYELIADKYRKQGLKLP
jgi:hypothetical protein